jgi:hypothetical protein
MKQKLFKLFILFVTMSVLTSSSKDCSINRANSSASDNDACMDTKDDYTLNITCKSKVVGKGISYNDARDLSLADNEISLSPVSRFILVQ